jgi:Tol biopolymer transport system component
MTHLRTIAVLLVLLFVTGLARAQIVERLDAAGPGVFGNVAAGRCVISDDGRYTAFLSLASNLVLPDDTVSVDVYLRDRMTQVTTRVGANVAQVDRLEISGDGRTIVYGVAHPGAPQFFHTTFAYDRVSGGTTQLAGMIFDSLPGAITADGHYMVLYGRSPALPGVAFDAYRLDLTTGALVLASRDMQGMPAGAEPERGGISADGDLVVFSSAASNLVAGDTNGVKDVFLFRVSTGAVTRMSVADLGIEADQDSLEPSISGDGNLVAFQSRTNVFDPTDHNSVFDVYLHDQSFGTTRRVTYTATGDDLDGDSIRPRISANGRYIAFDSRASNLIAGDSTFTTDVFIADLSSVVTRKVTAGSTVSGQESTLGNITGDGHFVALRSTVLSLPNAGVTGGGYLADFGPGCSAVRYCTPAGLNSLGVAAKVSAQGDASRLLNNFVLYVVNLPPSAISVLASGTAQVTPGVPFGNGLRCIGGTVARHGVLHAVGGVVIDFQDLSGPEYQTVQPGQTLYFQCIYRDPAAGMAAFNTSDALAVTFCY